MSKFRPGQLVKLAPGRLLYAAEQRSPEGLVTPNEENVFILIRPEMIGMFVEKLRPKSKSWQGYSIFLFEERLCLFREDSLVAVEPEEKE